MDRKSDEKLYTPRMADNENVERRQSRTKSEIKSDFRRFAKRWHVDTGATQVGRGRSEDVPVLQALMSLSKAENLDGWPENYKTGMRIAFPALSPQIPEKSIFLPKTPEEFFDLLDYIDRNGTFSSREFPLVEIAVERGRRNAENEDSDEDDEDDTDAEGDPTLIKFANFVSTRDSISALLYSLDLTSMYDNEQLQSIRFFQRFDDRAYFLFVRDAWNAKTLEEVQPLLDEIETKQEFKFYAEEARARTLAAIRERIKEVQEGISAVTPPEFKVGVPLNIEEEQRGLNQTMDRGARRHFIEELRDVSTLEEIERLESQVEKFSFFNRGELGIVRSVLSRKRKKLSQNTGS